MMVLITKIVALVALISFLYIGYVLFRDYKETLKSQNYEESSLFGKVLINLTFICINACILCTTIFLMFLIMSQITIKEPSFLL